MKDALYLKTHLNPESGSHLVATYTKRPLPLLPRINSLSADRPQSSTRRISGRSAHRVTSPVTSTQSHRKTPSSGGLESLIQDAARGVYTQGEKWGFNKAVRDAALSVRKNLADSCLR